MAGKLAQLIDRIEGMAVGVQSGARQIKETMEAAETAIMEYTKEGIVELEMSIDDAGWESVTHGGSFEFNPDTLKKLIRLARLMYIANPLIRRSVTVQELYVWGSGCEIKAEDPNVQKALDAFFKSPDNQKVVGDAFPEREREQRIDGNTFFVFFKNPMNGSLRVRLIPVDRVGLPVSDPEDYSCIWYYPVSNPLGGDIVYHPDIDYTPKKKLSNWDGHLIKWDNPIYHLKTGGLSIMKMGMPELYSSMNWATAYKKILENFATILSAYARMAMRISGSKGKDGNASAKSKLNTTVSKDNAIDKNPPQNVASWFAASGGMDISAVKTANSTTGPDEARALRSMVAAGADVPEHFFGDSDIGNFATSTTLDRPTELKMVARQDMWRKVILKMAQKVIEYSAAAPKGILNQAGYKVKYSTNDFSLKLLTAVLTVPSKGSVQVTITFPSILSRDIIDRVRSLVMGVTLNGSKNQGIIPDRKLIFKLLAQALDLEDVDALTEKYYPESVIDSAIPIADQFDNEKKAAQGRADLGTAALKQADAAVTKAENPPVTPTSTVKPNGKNTQ
jgi:hypothetical protein